VVIHGEAVAIGMVAASQIALKLGLWDEDSDLRQFDIIEKAKLPTQLPPGLNIDEILESLQTDKKVKAGKVRFVLPTRIGAATVTDIVTSDIIRQVLETSPVRCLA
jgi:3-dehydroquinate synthase